MTGRQIELIDKRIKMADDVIEFCEGAIRDAIYTEDGLDGGAGWKVLQMLYGYWKEHCPERYKRYQEELRDIEKQPLD